MVAKLHYENDMSQIDIARKLGVSTATISRLLTRARAMGIVRIEVLDLTAPDEIKLQLVKALGLKRAAVVDTPSTGVLAALASGLGGMLKDAEFPKDAVIGIGWGRAVREVIQAGLPRLPDTRSVALTGGLQQSAAHFQINEFVRQAAEQLGGTAHFLHAPYLSSVELRNVFMSDPSVKQTTDLWDEMECTIVGVGLPHAINPPEASAATIMEKEIGGAVGDVLRHYFDRNGDILPWDGEGRMIAATVQQLRKVPLSIGVAATVEKAPGIIGAVRSGMINSLVTDTSTALAILSELNESGSG